MRYKTILKLLKTTLLELRRRRETKTTILECLYSMIVDAYLLVRVLFWYVKIIIIIVIIITIAIMLLFFVLVSLNRDDFFSLLILLKLFVYVRVCV